MYDLCSMSVNGLIFSCFCCWIFNFYSTFDCVCSVGAACVRQICTAVAGCSAAIPFSGLLIEMTARIATAFKELRVCDMHDPLVRASTTDSQPESIMENVNEGEQSSRASFSL